jgi:hypothetical protein
MKHQIHVTPQDNSKYFDNKLSQKVKVIERIIRNIENDTGVVTRRGACPLEVVNVGGQWTIKGELREAQNSNAEKKTPKEKKWDAITRHEQILLTSVKFDTYEDWDECEQAAQEAFNSGTESLDGIPRFLVGQVYEIENKKYKIAKNNGKTVIYYGPEGEQKRTLEADTLGEFIRIDKEILHSIDFTEENKK